MAACRALCGRQPRYGGSRHPGRRRRPRRVHERLTTFAAEHSGHSTAWSADPAREPPSIDGQELTDKGSVNQKQVLANRADAGRAALRRGRSRSADRTRRFRTEKVDGRREIAVIPRLSAAERVAPSYMVARFPVSRSAIAHTALACSAVTLTPRLAIEPALTALARAGDDAGETGCAAARRRTAARR